MGGEGERQRKDGELGDIKPLAWLQGNEGRMEGVCDWECHHERAIGTRHFALLFAETAVLKRNRALWSTLASLQVSKPPRIRQKQKETGGGNEKGRMSKPSVLN